MEKRVRIVELAPSPAERAALERAARRGNVERIARGAWLIPPIGLTAILATFAFLRSGPDHLFGYAVAALFALAFLWVGISVLWPARADRTCPSCARQALERLDARTTRGLACSACGWRDATASSWYLAEEEGPLEEIVMRERGRSAAQSGAGPMESAR